MGTAANARLKRQTATILIGATTSDAQDLKGRVVVGLHMPAAFTGTVITFTACDTLAGTYRAVKDKAGAAVSVTVAAATFVQLDPTLLAGVQFLKLVSGSTELATRLVQIVTRAGLGG